MYKKEVLAKISEKSGINIAVCKKVLDVFEEVLDDEPPDSQKTSSAFNKVYNTLNFFRS